MTPAAPGALPPGRQRAGLFGATVALAFAGVQLGLMPLASLSVTRSLTPERYSDAFAGAWFTYYTAALMLGAALGGLGLGALGDRHGRVKALAASVALYAAGGLAGAFVQDQRQLLALRFLTGLGIGGAWPNAVVLGRECWTTVARPTVAGVLGASMNAGILALSQLGRVMPVTEDSWRMLMVQAAAPALAGAALLFFLPESPLWRQARAVAPVDRVPLGALVRQPLLPRTLAGIALGAIPLVGAWGASKWMIPWADQVGGSIHPGLKASTQGAWAIGATLGSFLGALVTARLGRRRTYFAVSAASTVLTCGLFLVLRPLDPLFLPVVLLQGLVSTFYFGWLPLCLPALFPTAVSAAGAGVAFNTGKLLSAAGVLGGGALLGWAGGDYGRIGLVLGLVYAFGLFAARWAPPDDEGERRPGRS